MTTIIIGAGAGGLACAIRLKQNNPNDEVIILERLEQAGRKILATGNGRCNLSNIDAENSSEVIEFFNGLGLEVRYEEGRIYPYSNHASTVLEILLNACNKLGIKIIAQCNALKIERDLTVKTDCGDFNADNVVVATGGMAQSALGSNGSGYEILKSIGHSITPLSPALVQLTSSSKYPNKLKGHRAKCNMTILLDGEAVKSEYGEVLFTQYGLSGIVTMNLSEIVSENFALKNPKNCHAVIDLVPEMSEEELIMHIEKFGSLLGILGSRLSEIINKQANGDIKKQAAFAKSWKLIITGTKGFDFAQITKGGADLNEFDGFRSKKLDGVYACGEVLDRQFECGGFNLNFAFYSGIKAADAIAGK
ncbi:MAG: aminoacetone oxidase family FAD-binding enzyme [Eubacterium sp.]